MNEEEVFLVIFRVRPGPTPARSRINRLLKYAGAWGIECLGFGDPAELARLRQEVIALRAARMPNGGISDVSSGTPCK
jgi:hypothetical protein